jgi:hypothetical protein
MKNAPQEGAFFMNKKVVSRLYKDTILPDF